jgi:hypothetical protein
MICLKKSLALLLIVSLNLAATKEEEKTADEIALEEATPKDEIIPTCFTEEQLKDISDGLEELDLCKKALEEYKDFSDKNYKKCEGTEWYQEPTFILGGMVIGFSLFGVVGYMMGLSK